MKQPH